MSSANRKKSQQSPAKKATEQLPARPADAVSPPHSTKVLFKSRQFEIKVTLHKIPEPCIRVHVTPTHFHLDTLKYSKKYYLSFEFPRKIKVNENNVEASLEHDILTVKLPILQISDQETGKLVKFGVTQGGDDDDSEEDTKKKPAKKQQHKAKATQATKKTTKPIVEEAPEEDDVSDDEVDADNEEVESPVKSAKPERKIPQKKKLSAEQRQQLQERKKPVELNAALRIAEQIASKQQTQAEIKLEKQANRDDFFEKKEAQKAAKKERKEQMKKQLLDKIVQEQKQKRKEEQALKKVPKRKIRFDDETAPAATSKKTKRTD